jgi:type I restriction enzyme S subunit
MKKYNSYKKIKSAFFYEIPSLWKRYRIKDIVDRNTYYPVGDGDHGSIKPEMYQDEGIPYIRVQNLTWHGEIIYGGMAYISEELQLANKKSILLPGDILVAKTGATIGKLGLMPETIPQANTTSSVGKVTIDKKRFYSKYILYCFQTHNLHEQIWLKASQKSAQPGFNIDDLIVFEIVAPEKEEQIKIVKYLDYQTSIIDQLIQQKEKLIELLNEKRQAVANEVVTKGLDPKVKMKDSGIEWLGEVPNNWKVTKMKFIATITRGAILRPVDDPDYFDDNGEWTYLNISDATKCDKYLHEGKLRLSELGSQKSARVLPNNLILTASATIGKPFINKIPVCVHDGFIPITNIKCSIDYLYHYLRNPQLYVALGKVNTQKNIYLDEVKDMFITQPPLNEQNDIIAFLEKFEVKNNNLISQVGDQIAKLKEYRQSVISEAVTGKIDVRDWQPKKH